MRLIDADALCAGLVSNHPVVIHAKNAPTVDAVPVVHGHWISTGFMEVKCSICGAIQHELEDTNYCPNCGAKMDGERRENV